MLLHEKWAKMTQNAPRRLKWAKWLNLAVFWVLNDKRWFLTFFAWKKAGLREKKSEFGRFHDALIYRDRPKSSFKKPQNFSQPPYTMTRWSPPAGAPGGRVAPAVEDRKPRPPHHLLSVVHLLAQPLFSKTLEKPKLAFFLANFVWNVEIWCFWSF